MDVANAAVENIDGVLDSRPITYGFQYGTRGFNINQARITSVFREMEHHCAVSDGISILYKKTEYGEGVYLSDLGERKYGDWLVLWQASKPSNEEPCGRRFYMSVQERGEEEEGLTLCGAAVYELLGEQGVIYTTGIIRTGISVEDVSVTSAAGQLQSIGHPISGATAFVDIAQEGYCYVSKGSLTLNPLKVVGGREERIPSEKELLESWDQYLEEHWGELEAKYKGKYVAIWEGTVYDSDPDLAALAKRVYSTLGYRSIFMPYIGKRRSVAEFLSPV